MAPKYRLSYFGAKGIAEPIRFLFAYKGVEYEDVRIESADWPALKQNMPWNIMPVLEEDGKQLSQSTTILRYLGRKFGLAGSDEFQTAKCNEYVDAAADFRLEAMKFFKEEDEIKKAELKKKFTEETIPNFVKKTSEILKKNGNNVLVGNGITYADFYVSVMIESILGLLQMNDLIEKNPEVAALINNVNNQTGIKAWISKRPVTMY